MNRRRSHRSAIAIALVLALTVLPSLGVVARAFQGGEIFSPASGRAQVIAQGVASLPQEAAWRAVFHSIDPGGSGELPVGGPGFFLVDTGGVVLRGDGRSTLLAPNEAAFHDEGTAQLTPIGDRPAGIFAIDLTVPDAAADAGGGIPVFAGEPFAAPAGERDVDLVRALLDPGESTTVIGNAAPVLVLVTLGAVQAEATDGSTADLRVGEAATLSGDVIITAEGQAPAAIIAAVVGREVPSAAATPGATPASPTTGSVEVAVYACPPAVTAASASADTCLRDPEAAALTLSAIDGPELRDVGPSRERQGRPAWTGLPAGEYALQATEFKSGFGLFFVRGLEGLAEGAESGFPAGVRGGYRIPIGDVADYALEVFVLGPDGEGSPTPAAISSPQVAVTPEPTTAPEATGTPGPTDIASVIEIEDEESGLAPVPTATSTPRPAPLATATPRSAARPIVTSTAVARPRLGSIALRVFGCANPIEIFDPASCAQAVDGFDVRLIDEEGEVIGLDLATIGDDGAVIWEDLPLGSYLVQQPVLLPGATTYYVPDLPLNADSSGYIATIDRENPEAVLSIYSLPPSVPPTVAPTAPQAALDSDGDGLPDADETGIHGTDPGNFDSDGDGVSDGAEVAAGTSPLGAAGTAPVTSGGDADGDRLADADEAGFGTDPNNPDSDGDGYFDGDEVNLGTSPLDPASVPAG
jgi:hypothetical protein